jgi:hypothetical protein
MDSRNAQPAVAALTECALAAFLPVAPSRSKLNSDWKATTSPCASPPPTSVAPARYIELMMPHLRVGTHIQATLWLDGHPIVMIVIRRRVITCHPQYDNGMMFEKFEGQAEQFLQPYLDAIVTTT